MSPTDMDSIMVHYSCLACIISEVPSQHEEGQMHCAHSSQAYINLMAPTVVAS